MPNTAVFLLDMVMTPWGSVVINWVGELLLHGELIDNLVGRHNAGSIADNFLLLVVRLHRPLQGDRAAFGDDLHIVCVGGEVLVGNDGLPYVRRSLPV